MKYNISINLEVSTGDDIEINEVVRQLLFIPFVPKATVVLTGYNVNRAYEHSSLLAGVGQAPQTTAVDTAEVPQKDYEKDL